MEWKIDNAICCTTYNVDKKNYGTCMGFMDHHILRRKDNFRVILLNGQRMKSSLRLYWVI